MTTFDYESKVWGGVVVKPSPFYIQGLKLKYTLEDLAGVNGNILDIGCGGGNMAKAIKRYRPDLVVYGVDISRQAIKEAKKNPGGVKFSVSATEKLPFKSKHFDAITMYDVLEHVDNQYNVLKEIRRILKDDGVFHLFLPLDGQKGTIYQFLSFIGWKSKIKFTGHTIAYSDSDAVKIYNKAGFKVINKKFSFHYFFSLFDFLYFTFLDLFNIKPTSSIEGEISKRNKSLFFKTFNLFYRFIVYLSYWESTLLKSVPGGGADYLLVKKMRSP